MNTNTSETEDGSEDSFYENYNKYLLLKGTKLVLFENGKWSSRKKYNLDSMTCSSLSISTPLLVHCRDILPELWEPVKRNDIVTDAKCLTDLSMLLCNGCFNGEWKMELKKKGGIFYLQAKPALKGLFDLDFDIRSIKDKFESSNEDDEEEDLISESAVENTDPGQTRPRCTCTCKPGKNPIEKLDPIDVLLSAQNKAKLLRFCRWRLDRLINVFFTSEVSLFKEELSEEYGTQPFKMYKKDPSSLSPKDIFSVAFDCKLAHVKNIIFPSPNYSNILGMNLAVHEFEKVSTHNVLDGMEELTKRLKTLIIEFEKIQNENVVMEIKKKKSCSVLKFTFRLEEL